MACRTRDGKLIIRLRKSSSVGLHRFHAEGSHRLASKAWFVNSLAAPGCEWLNLIVSKKGRGREFLTKLKSFVALIIVAPGMRARVVNWGNDVMLLSFDSNLQDKT
jgi:hypothetical protein